MSGLIVLPQVGQAVVLTRDAYEQNPSTTLGMTGSFAAIWKAGMQQE
jgi:hypothetical protein